MRTIVGSNRRASGQNPSAGKGRARLAGLLVLGLAFQGVATARAADLWRDLDHGFFDNAYWYDGQAEINLYDARLVIYGEPRPAEEVAHIVVSEDHRPDQLVKADDPSRPDKVGMLKFNYTTDVRTGVYAYRQMLSFFFDRSDLHVAKMTLAHHEWCGNTFKELVNFRGRSSYHFNTYWDGQGAGSFEVDFPERLVIHDSLPVQLRALRFREGLEGGIQLLPRQLSSQAGQPIWKPAVVRVVHRGPLEVPAGTFDAWAVEVEHVGGLDRLWFEAEFPHRMLRWLRADGDRFDLEHSRKMAYWRFNQPRHDGALED